LKLPTNESSVDAIGGTGSGAGALPAGLFPSVVAALGGTGVGVRTVLSTALTFEVMKEKTAAAQSTVAQFLCDLICMAATVPLPAGCRNVSEVTQLLLPHVSRHFANLPPRFR
jgi:hypothetical protein